LIPPIIADTGGLLRALARTHSGQPSFPEYEKILTSAAAVIVPGLVLAEVDYFLRDERKAMCERKRRIIRTSGQAIFFASGASIAQMPAASHFLARSASIIGSSPGL
jgi:hypothetical protein